MDGWQIAGGSVTGTRHLNPIKFGNNQDSFYWVNADNVLIAVVSDGCSSSAHSEVGAKIGCRLVANHLSDWFSHFGSDDPEAIRLPYLWEVVRVTVLEDICKVVCGMGGIPHRIIKDYFLFTVMGVMMGKGLCVLFSIGDGFSMLNKTIFELGVYPKNEPPYMMYGAMQDKLENPTPELYKFQINAVWFMDSIDHVVIGSDGVSDHLMKVPGFDISEFWTNDNYFRNSDLVRRRLAVINKTNFVNVRGPLKDDTTLVVIRRTPKESG